eukprot:11182219-Lingulodinium_polyedra.AAC.1
MLGTGLAQPAKRADAVGARGPVAFGHPKGTCPARNARVKGISTAVLGHLEEASGIEGSAPAAPNDAG